MCLKALQLYATLIEELDAIDNGIEVSDAPLRYKVTTTLSSRIGRLNPSWNKPNTPEAMNERFREAMLVATGEFVDRARGFIESWWPAREIVARALECRQSVHPSGQVILLDR
jgi:uncharacterized UPF0160 family protein